MMRRLPFEPPTDFYNEKLRTVDEQIVELLRTRNTLSEGNPGFPQTELIEKWARETSFYPDFLHAVFNILMEPENFRPMPEPHTFKKHVPVMKAAEVDGTMYSMTFIRQYENASELSLHIDYDTSSLARFEHIHRHYALELTISPDYDVFHHGGAGSKGHMTNTYLISPPLPNDLSGLIFRFKGEIMEEGKEPKQVEFTFQTD